LDSRSNSRIAINVHVSGAFIQVKLNVKDYKPDELNVKISNGLVTIEGKHEQVTVPEKDKDGKPTGPEERVYRHFKRTFTVPKNVIEEKLECKLTEDGQLVMWAPARAIEAPSEPLARTIPIAAAGVEKQLENKEGDAGEKNGQ
jgi:crystallin alpha B